MIKKVKFFSIMLCLFFSILTVLSSTLQLIQGRESDTNIHILMRFAICVIAVLFWATFSAIRLKNVILTVIVQYISSMVLIFAGLYISGFFIELADSAYRDIFLNYSIPFVIITAIVIIYSKRKKATAAK